jgi:hypothetical protein
MTELRIGRATLVYTPEGCFTRYDDGATYGAHPHDTSHYHVISHRTGYGDDILAYCREHEAAHHMVSEWIAGGASQVLWPLAHGEPVIEWCATFEEMAAQQFQRWLRANERPIIGGVQWDELKRRALGLLDAI